MASYDTRVGDHTVTISYMRGGTGQMGVKRPGKVKAWAICPVTAKRIEAASESVGEATRAVEVALGESVAAAENEAAEAPATEAAAS